MIAVISKVEISVNAGRDTNYPKRALVVCKFKGVDKLWVCMPIGDRTLLIYDNCPGEGSFDDVEWWFALGNKEMNPHG